MVDIGNTLPPTPESPEKLGLYIETETGILKQDLYSLKNEDSTFSGAMEIDGSTDISTALYVDGSMDVLNAFGCASDFVVAGDMTVDGTVKWGADLSAGGNAWFDGSVDISGALDCSVLSVDGSSDFSAVWVDGSAEFSQAHFDGSIVVLSTADMSAVQVSGDFSADSTAVFGAKVIFEGDVSGVGGGFVDRGDSASFDWNVADLNTDNTWRDLSVGSTATTPIVPAGAKAVLLQVAFRDDNAIGTRARFRENGNSNTINIGSCRSQVAASQNDADLVISCDSNGELEYQVSNATIDLASILVKGWWL